MSDNDARSLGRILEAKLLWQAKVPHELKSHN